MRFALVALFSLLLSACQSPSLHYQFANSAPQPASEQTAALLGAVVEVDITPPPGMPKAGFAIWSAYGDGFRTRLKARVFYLRPKGGEPLVLVQTDLLAGSEILHAALSQRLAAVSEIAPQNLVLAANHTHAAPGQYFGNDFYNQHASNAAGFDQRWFNFLAQRIEGAILQARGQLRPAKLAVGQSEIWGQTRNRALEPYLNNPEVTDKDASPGRVFQAINPTLTMVRIDLQDGDGQYRPRGVFSSFSIHGTGIGSDTAFYHADVWAYIANELAWRVQQQYGLDEKPIHGAFEATHGDVAPNVEFEHLSYAEARRVGSNIGAQAFDLFRQLDGQLHERVELHSALREVDVLQQPSIGAISLCQPALGAALAAGPIEHHSPLIWQLPFIHPGQPKTWFADDCQGAKHWLGTHWLQPLIAPPETFPHRLLIQTLQIDNSYWAMLPFEVTVMSGQLIAKQMQQSLADAGRSAAPVLVSSVANGYTGYVTTPSEYALQYYEGGHTLYGSQTAPFLAAHSGRLLGEMLARGNFADLSASRDFDLELGAFWPPAQTEAQPRQVLQPPQLISDEEEPYWRLQWQDQAPAAMAFEQPLLQIETLQQGQWQPFSRAGRLEDDQGFDLAVRWLGNNDYEARWYNPATDGASYRLRIEPRAGQPALRVGLPR
ncbi:MAG: neutral/alkaline non-lysosomal ceramidase N-terminal domain-containing protein [Pseudomonas sp.]|uniref:neutral/alkaline non-lysosomal ceramidase N-terminal domain-containing protein n=1 Tax=Pseudomonas sp. TaxID=306 RepID=UPI003BB7ED08